MENHASVTGWQKLFFSYKCFQLSAAIAKILRLPIFNMLFQLVLTKFFKSELFSYLPKVDHVIKSRKEPIVSVRAKHVELIFAVKFNRLKYL